MIGMIIFSGGAELKRTPLPRYREIISGNFIIDERTPRYCRRRSGALQISPLSERAVMARSAEIKTDQWRQHHQVATQARA